MSVPLSNFWHVAASSFKHWAQALLKLASMLSFSTVSRVAYRIFKIWKMFPKNWKLFSNHLKMILKNSFKSSSCTSQTNPKKLPRNTSRIHPGAFVRPPVPWAQGEMGNDNQINRYCVDEWQVTHALTKCRGKRSVVLTQRNESCICNIFMKLFTSDKQYEAYKVNTDERINILSFP